MNLKFRGRNFSRLLSDLRNPRKFSTSKILGYTVYLVRTSQLNCNVILIDPNVSTDIKDNSDSSEWGNFRLATVSMFNLAKQLEQSNPPQRLITPASPFLV